MTAPKTRTPAPDPAPATPSTPDREVAPRTGTSRTGASRTDTSGTGTSQALPTPSTDAPDTTAQAGPTDDGTGTAGAEPKRRGRPKGSTARTTRTVELTLTVSGTADGEWQAELKRGSSWLSRGLPVTAAAVLRAAQELHPELAEPIDAVIGAAREQRAAKVAALEAELEQARKALAEMAD